MSARLRHRLNDLRSTFWVVPAAMIVLAAVLAAATHSLDTALAGSDLPGWVYSGGAEGAFALLSTVAASVITVAGLGYSITIVALVMASTQFGPRLLTLFMRDRISQVTLGIFALTFTFCVLILRTIRAPSESVEAFVPQISVTVSIGLVLLSLATLIYFFHHVALSIQAPRVAAAVARDLDQSIDHLYPGSMGAGGPEPDSASIPDPATGRPIAADRSGYVQVVDDDALLALATRHVLCVRIMTRPGLFVVRGNAVLVVDGEVDDQAARQLAETMIIGDTRTAEDDIEFSVRQLVEVALRALSPAINDPFTAMTAVDWLSGALARLAQTDFPSRYRYDADGHLRVVANVSTFGGIAHTVFSRIRHYGGSSPMVLNRLLEAIAAFGPKIRDEADRALIHAEADSVLAMGRELLHNQTDLDELDKRYRAAVTALTR